MNHPIACLASFKRLVALALTLLSLQGTAALALVPSQPPSGTHAGNAAAPPAGIKSAAAAPAPRQAKPAKSAWIVLTPAQQQALAPLADTWDSLPRAQQRKWLLLSRNYLRMDPVEQKTLHGRMSEWSRLSTQERAQARLNFGEAKQLSTADKKALWEAYQALPAEERTRLATGAAAKPPTTAAGLRPIPRQKLTRVPGGDSRGPRIAAAPATLPGADDAQSGPMAEPAPRETH